MLISDEVEIILNSANMCYFKSLGYDNLKKGNKLMVPVEHLTKGSHSIVKVKCDICEEEKDLMYRYYAKSLRSNNFYSCPKCSNVKIIKTNMNKYGVENYSQTDEYKEKVKQTCFEKYGVKNPSQVEEFKDKRKDTMLERHGVEYYVLSEDFLNKSQQTSMKNYGTINPMMSDEIKKVMKDYYIKMGFHVTTKDFEIYKNKVYLLTKKVKKDLINIWDGKDYYDGERIKENFDLPYYHKNYPTIDHKITIFEGFKNNILAEEIANISNLCFTKRCINSRKHIKNESNFYFGADI